ncbi:MAG: hypothetical protein V1746_05875 [bacterium]
MGKVSKEVEELLSVDASKRRIDDAIDLIISINDFGKPENLRECQSATATLLDKGLDWSPEGKFPLFPSIDLHKPDPEVTTFWRVTDHPDPGLGGVFNGQVFASPSLSIASFFGPLFNIMHTKSHRRLLPPEYMFLAKYELDSQQAKNMGYHPIHGILRGEKGCDLNEIVQVVKEENAKNGVHHREITADQWINYGLEVLIPSDREAKPYMIRMKDPDHVEESLKHADKVLPRELSEHIRFYVAECADFEIAEIPDTGKWPQFLGRVAQVNEILLKDRRLYGLKRAVESEEARFLLNAKVYEIEQAIPVAQEFAEKNKGLLDELQNWENSVQRTVGREALRMEEQSFEMVNVHLDDLRQGLSKVEGYSEYRLVETAKRSARKFVSSYQGVEDFPRACEEITRAKGEIKSIEKQVAARVQTLLPDPTEADITKTRHQELQSSKVISL